MAVVVLPTPGEPDSKAALCMDPSWSFLKNDAGIKKKQIVEKEHYDEQRDNLYYSLIHSISPFLVS